MSDRISIMPSCLVIGWSGSLSQRQEMSTISLSYVYDRFELYILYCRVV